MAERNYLYNILNVFDMLADSFSTFVWRKGILRMQTILCSAASLMYVQNWKKFKIDDGIVGLLSALIYWVLNLGNHQLIVLG
jgi:hypothetical protein